MFNPNILRHSLIWGPADEAVLRKSKNISEQFKFQKSEIFSFEQYIPFTLKNHELWLL